MLHLHQIHMMKKRQNKKRLSSYKGKALSQVSADQRNKEILPAYICNNKIEARTVQSLLTKIHLPRNSSLSQKGYHLLRQPTFSKVKNSMNPYLNSKFKIRSKTNKSSKLDLVNNQVFLLNSRSKRNLRQKLNKTKRELERMMPSWLLYRQNYKKSDFKKSRLNFGHKDDQLSLHNSTSKKKLCKRMGGF